MAKSESAVGIYSRRCNFAEVLNRISTLFFRIGNYFLLLKFMIVLNAIFLLQSRKEATDDIDN